MVNIEEYRLEIILLQERDTKLAKDNGFVTLEEWYCFIINQSYDEIAEAVISIAERYNISVDTVANHFDPSMIMRVGKILAKNNPISKAA